MRVHMGWAVRHRDFMLGDQWWLTVFAISVGTEIREARLWNHSAARLSAVEKGALEARYGATS